jgi:hypothetical protein
MSWRAVAGIVAVALIIVAALCWTIADSDRSQRLIALIRACHSNNGQRASRSQ